MRIFLAIFLLLLLIPFSSARVGENKGVDSIFLEIGLDKPIEWSSWSKGEKFSYLQNRGLYPEYGNHYQGDANIEGFFTWLGVEKPTNWNLLTFEQRKDFVSRIQYPEKYLEQQEEEKKRLNIFSAITILITLAIMITSFLKPANKFKKTLREGIYYGLPLILLILTLLNPERAFFAQLGEWSQRLIVFLLFIKPLSIIFPWRPLRRAVAYRRESGIASFWFFIFHAGGLIYVRNLTTLASFKVSFLFWGLIAGIGMIFLAATSNDESIKYFKRNWKRIQYITYGVFFAVLAHSSLWTNNFTKVYVLGGTFIVLKILQLYKTKSKNKK